MTDWTRPVDIYCERLGPGFWAEPVNALTNAAFLAAALWAWRYAAKHERRDPTIATLAVLLGAIGVGSFLFHTVATAWSGLADVLPIWTFTAVAFTVALHRFFGIRPTQALIGLAAIVALTLPLARALPSLSGSLSYLPALLCLAGIAAALQRTRRPAWKPIAAAATLFALSLGFCTAAACAAFPLGTHFLWHLLNATVLGLVMKGLIDGKEKV